TTELVTTYKVENLPTGERRMTNAGCCGGPIVSVVSPDGTTTITHPDGTVVTTIQGPDPRFGMQAPIVAKMTVKTPSGLVYEQEAYRYAELVEAGNPLSLVNLSDYTTINGRTYATIYDASTRRITTTTPEGRESFTYLDEKGRVVRTEVPGLAPVSFEYDGRGRLVTITEGEGLEARMSRLEYNAQGYLERITDTLTRTTNFEYDAAGRVSAQIRPDGTRIPFTYDANGNVTSITPPGKPAHTFTYTPVDLEETYNPPPVVGGGMNQIRYDYNLNRQVIQITRPDGQTIGFAYDTMGRLVTVSTPEGESGYVYDATSGNLTDIIAVDGGALSYTYDGFLLTKVSWAGSIVGSVGYGYDNDLRLTSLKVNGANEVMYEYDGDGLLTRAGRLTLAYDPQNGLLTGTALEGVTDSYAYNEFGEVTDYVAEYNGMELYRVHLEYDKLGRITSKTETVAGETHTYVYGYDATGRLTDVIKDGVLVSHYDYDDNGNRLAHTTPAGAVYGNYDDQDRMLFSGDATYEYTADGELLRKSDAEGTTH
ncbi:MAG: RHS repeat protein, partial [Firmicutes bacterium]|nr:RHS repeat protein [Bacillota bacterium]